MHIDKYCKIKSFQKKSIVLVLEISSCDTLNRFKILHSRSSICIDELAAVVCYFIFYFFFFAFSSFSCLYVFIWFYTFHYIHQFNKMMWIFVLSYRCVKFIWYCCWQTNIPSTWKISGLNLIVAAKNGKAWQL